MMSSSAGFVHLHGHSEFSLLDGGCKVKAMAERAAELGMPALAVTDHGSMFGAIEHYNACKKAGIKPIIGSEVYVAIESRHLRKAARGLSHGSNHLVLLAKNNIGYRNLTKLVSKGYLEGYYYNPRIDKELLREYSEGLICLSGCVGGEIPHLINRDGLAEAEQAALEFADIFGDDFYLEIQRHGIDIEPKINDGLLKLHKKLGLPLVATNDFHFLSADDHAAHDALICIQTGKTIQEENRMCYPEGLYMKSPDEMYALFDDYAYALENTVKIAEQCDIELTFGEMHMPNFPIPEEFANDAEYLTHLANEGLKQRYERIDTALQERLDYELGIINEMGFPGYFLIVQDYIDFAKNNGISVGPGRGSVAGSLVAYCLRITDTDPIKHTLLFERFLNPERISMPDIDIDFADTGRDKIIRYVVEKYGEANVSQVITFGTMGAKAVIRDVGRVLGLSFGEVDVIAKLVPNELKITLGDAIDKVPELRQMADSRDEKGQLISYARKLEGLARHASVHAAAVIIAPGDITDYVPLYRAPKDGRVTTQFDGPTCEDMGLLKMDFLGLKELSLMDEATRLIRLQEPDFDLDAIPWDDRLTFELFSRGETVGVFQFESSGMREYLKQLEPDKLEDVIAMNALYRPGPMARIPDFIDRKHGRQEVTYDHEVLEPVLEETYGVITYQEQVQRIARDMSGFTLGQPDGIRKAMGKKMAALMEKYKKDFLAGAVANGVERDIAQKVWADIEVFSGYGFNKSHSASYAEVAYKNAYLKANFPKDYMAASLTTDRNNTDRLTILLDECRHMEIPVLPPDVNESTLNFTPTEEGIRFGMAAIKNVGEGAAQNIVDVRVEGGAFGDLFEFCERLDLHAVNRRVIESLIAAGALDGLEGHRAQQFEALDLALRAAQKAQDARERGQISLFEAGNGSGGAEMEKFELPEVEEWNETDQLARERELLGFYISSHPLNPYLRDLKSFGTSLSELENQQAGYQMRVGGLITRISKLHDRRGQPFAFITLEDMQGKGDVAFFSEVYAAHQELLEQDQVIMIEGRVTERNGRLSLQAEKAMPLEQAREQLTKAVNLSLPYEEVEREMLAELKRLCERYMGDCELLLHLKNGGEKDAVVRSRSIRVKPCDELLHEIDGLIGPKRTWLTMETSVPRPVVQEERRRWAS
ncbi:MAG: DNA polymerase III subunit alpha [Gemmatimonadetes bacterium]|nr:DNA polymerase III subunit alpha [Gemmatimonadota bacterium]